MRGDTQSWEHPGRGTRNSRAPKGKEGGQGGGWGAWSPGVPRVGAGRTHSGHFRGGASVCGQLLRQLECGAVCRREGEWERASGRGGVSVSRNCRLPRDSPEGHQVGSGMWGCGHGRCWVRTRRARREPELLWRLSAAERAGGRARARAGLQVAEKDRTAWAPAGDPVTTALRESMSPGCGEELHGVERRCRAQRGDSRCAWAVGQALGGRRVRRS